MSEIPDMGRCLRKQKLLSPARTKAIQIQSQIVTKIVCLPFGMGKRMDIPPMEGESKSRPVCPGFMAV